MVNWREFFEDADGGLSMTRLLCFLSFFPASYALIEINTEGALGWYLGAYVLGYVGGKSAEALARPSAGGVTNVNIAQPEKVNVGPNSK